MSQQYAAGENAQTPRFQAEGGKRSNRWTGPGGNDGRVIPYRFRAIEEEIPHHGTCLVIKDPRCFALGGAGVMAGAPVIHGYIRAGFQMGTLYRRGAGGYPADKIRTVPLPDGVENT